MLNVSDNITGIGKLYGKEVKKNNVSFMKTERLGVDFKLASSKFKIKDYLNGNNVLGEMSLAGRGDWQGSDWVHLIIRNIDGKCMNKYSVYKYSES